jgi:probable phosphoglycerate mutase
VEIVFVRHGEPAWVMDGRPQMDPPLTERGRAQAERVAERLSRGHRKPAEILVSCARRAKETAAPLADKTGIAPTVVDDLVELKLPDWSQLAPEEVVGHFRAARARALHEWWDGLPGGESFRDFHDRVAGALASILRERGVTPVAGGPKHLYEQTHDPGRVVVVGHGGTNSVAMSLLLGVEAVPWEWERIALHHVGIIRMKTIRLGGGVVWSLRSHNDVEHLPREMRTR